MEFEGFEWDHGNSAKCQKHGVSIAEIESVFSQAVLIVNDQINSDVEDRLRAIGATKTGRRAFIVFTMRGGLIRPLSARYMHQKEVDRYEKDNPEI